MQILDDSILPYKKCIQLIKNEKCFSTKVAEIGLHINIYEYTFFVCVAIHNGHKLREELIERCLLSDKERLFEEDPLTGNMVESMPISLISEDSRYEYDLNRSEKDCVYERAWDKDVWDSKLDVEAINKSKNKHRIFYEILNALLEKIKEKYNSCVVYDLHSFNYLRIEREDIPVFNIGTEQIYKEKWSGVIDNWVRELKKANLPNLNVRVGIDEVFYGRGYLATFIREKFDNILVLPTEIKKVYMN